MERNKRIAIIGNGGSCSTAEHLACDLRSKGYSAEALTNSSIITQIGNDLGFQYVFSEQLKKGFDCLIAFSVSGNSPNILEALKYAKKKGMIVEGYFGNNGGKAKKYCNKAVCFPEKDFEYVENKHLQIVHNLKLNKIVWTNGCFDVLHAGHTEYLRKAGMLGTLVVGITSDKTLRKEKREPIFNENERAKIISAIEGVQETIIYDSAADEIRRIQPDIYVKGGDYTIDTINQEEKNIVKTYNGEIRFINSGFDSSSSKIIKKIKNSK